MKLDIKENKPKKEEVILFKDKLSTHPEVGIYQEFDDVCKVYVISCDDVADLDTIDWWMKIPQD
ncbi:hypothetical protein Phi4:1_gp111 [Cellulophaga phage phi4:1]|uniref:Uncharacterized protein n=3 Tax=Lightbulbvirus Cba41 TaxID=1918524 RepID=A0A0S2MWP1_9CAUD|nr:hypothetical protein Phi4:1_gp111 [Cellulophaga phage phi4:1]AGO49524.1 hypothetical protein Phi4:1_gp111 [Cellulophaga phage phi4:1]ALO80120.1 hypothetical protein Phi4113_111 [Cellulophaga phage phi4:1_13]ALO80317.1 hypothetical protein Phi4118_111 [Cellulophaga phage phi4:1_18]